MFEGIRTFERTDLVDYVSSIFGDDVRSFTRVISGDRADVFILRKFSRRNRVRWDSLYIVFYPDHAEISVHYDNGLYVVTVDDERGLKRSINRWRAPKNAKFVGGVNVPRGVDEYYYFSPLHEVYLRRGDSVAVVGMQPIGDFEVPKNMTVASWPDYAEDLTDPLVKRAVYENGLAFRVHPVFLVRGAPEKYYELYHIVRRDASL